MTGDCTSVIDLPTLPCQIETAQVLLVLVVAYPSGFLIWMAFFTYGPSVFYLDCGVSKVPGDVLKARFFTSYPVVIQLS